MHNLDVFWQATFPVLATLFGFGLLLWGANWMLFRRLAEQEQHQKFPRQMLMLVLILASVIGLVISLPIAQETQTQILSLIGIIISGLLAFSSTNIVSNLVAGAMMRFTSPFVTGDFIRVKEYAGRVTERGLFDCEIQTEHRELVAIPNNFLITNPVTVVRNSGAIVSASLSLGYDLHHSDIEALLKQAATEIGLEEPFVHVTELGDFSVTYKVSGLLIEVKNLITSRSRLYRQILDVLHQNNIEIMSPGFVNQRKLADDYRVLAKPKQAPQPQTQTVAEDIIFDKAEVAHQHEEQKNKLTEQLVQLQQQLSEAEGDKKDQIKLKIDQLEAEIVQQVALAEETKKQE